jgi:hypothetical protein
MGVHGATLPRHPDGVGQPVHRQAKTYRCLPALTGCPQSDSNRHCADFRSTASAREEVREWFGGKATDVEIGWLRQEAAHYLAKHSTEVTPRHESRRETRAGGSWVVYGTRSPPPTPRTAGPQNSFRRAPGKAAACATTPTERRRGREPRRHDGAVRNAADHPRTSQTRPNSWGTPTYRQARPVHPAPPKPPAPPAREHPRRTTKSAPSRVRPHRWHCPSVTF